MIVINQHGSRLNLATCRVYERAPSAGGIATEIWVYWPDQNRPMILCAMETLEQCDRMLAEIDRALARSCDLVDASELAARVRAACPGPSAQGAPASDPAPRAAAQPEGAVGSRPEGAVPAGDDDA